MDGLPLRASGPYGPSAASQTAPPFVMPSYKAKTRADHSPTDTALSPIGVTTSDGIAWTTPVDEITLQVHLRSWKKDPQSEGLHTHTNPLQHTVLITFDPSYPELNHGIVCGNNPVMYVDPSGHIFGVDDAIVIVVLTTAAKAAAVGAAAGATVAAVNGTNIGQGAITGGISGALISLGGVAGGALAGGINASITGGDLGQGALYGAIGAAAGGLMNLGIGQLGIENPYVQAGVSIAGGGLVAGGITAIAGGDFGQGFVNGVTGAAAGYFAGMGMSALQRSPVSASPEQVAEKAFQDMEVSKSDTTSQGGTTPDGPAITLVRGGAGGPGRPSAGFRNEDMHNNLRDMSRFLNEQQKAFGERNSRQYRVFCDKWESKTQYYTKPGSPDPNRCLKWGYHPILSF